MIPLCLHLLKVTALQLKMCLTVMNIGNFLLCSPLYLLTIRNTWHYSYLKYYYDFLTTVCEAQGQRLWWAFPIVFWSLPNIFRKESGYFIQNLNKFPFMVIVSNFEEITPQPTNLKVQNLQSDFSVSNSVRSNFLNKPPNKISISTMSFVLQN